MRSKLNKAFIVIAKCKFFLVTAFFIGLLAACGDQDSAGGGSYRLIDTYGNTLDDIDAPENISAYDSLAVENDNSGGAACLASILNYLFGYSLSESDAIEGMMLYGNYGQIQPSQFSFYDMKLYVEASNNEANGYTYDDLCSFQAFDSDEISTVLGAALLPIRIDSNRHYAVLQGYDNDYAYFSSPLYGKICVGYAIFCEINYSEEIFVVWADGIDPLAKGISLPLGNFRQIL